MPVQNRVVTSLSVSLISLKEPGATRIIAQAGDGNLLVGSDGC